MSLPYKMHKNKSALRLRVISPEREKYQEGNVWGEFAEFKAEVNGNKTYDWESKISVKLSADDLGRFLYTLKTGIPVSIYHEFNDTVKTISLGPSGDKWFFSVDQKHPKSEDKSNNKKISMLMTSHELTVVQALIEQWIPLLF
jgi:hypothetical protein